MSNLFNDENKNESDNFYLRFIPKKWPSLFSLILMVVTIILASFILNDISNFTADGSGFSGIGLFFSEAFFTLLMTLTVYFLFFCVVLRNLEFKDFFKKETYVRNLSNIFYCFIAIILIFFLVGYFISDFLRTTYH